MKKLKYIFFILQILGVISSAQAQAKKITGRVVDSSGQVIIGATIAEKGFSSNATSADASGRFSLALKGSSNRLVVSSISYITQEVSVAGTTNITVKMVASKAETTDEVVVVGYGRQKKLTATGAVSSVSGAELRQNPSASVQNTLAGRLPGFFSQQSSGRPGADGANFTIRGVSSYNAGSTTPLIIVDDIEFSYDQFARIDPNEIETLSILKDASTTAVYGVRGANGVLVVTTRRGKIGPPQISVRTELGLTQPTLIPKYLNAYETLTLYNQAQINDKQTPTYSADDLQKYKDHSDPYGHPDVDWRTTLFKKFSQQYRGNIDISGGTDKVKYFVSGGYIYQDGMVKDFSNKVGINSNYYNQRYNYRSNLDIKVTGTTDLRLDLYGNIGIINQPQVGSPFGYNDLFYDYSSFFTLAPFAYPIYNPDGSFGYSNWAKSPGTGGTAYDVNNVVGRLTYLGYTRTFENNMNLVATANQKLDFITKGLAVKGTVSYASSYGDPTSGANNTISMSGGDFPSFIYDPTSNGYTPRTANIFRVRRLIRSSSSGATVRTLAAQAFITYDRTFSNKHHLYGLVLYNQNTVTRYVNTATYNFIPSNLLGVTARVGYDYRQKYLVELNGAYNGSDRFSAANRYGYFPAASAGWNISEEPFFKDNVKFVDKLKIRGSYGLVGNDKIGNNFAYYYQQTYSTTGGVTSFGNPSANSGNAIYEGTLGNPTVSWEKENKLDIGLDISMFRNSVTATIDYFNNNRYDILTNRSASVSAVFGQGLPPVNLGKVNNKGIEVEVNYSKSVNKNLSFSVKGTYSYAKNTIIYQNEPVPKYPWQTLTGNSIGTQLVYTFVGFYKDSSDIAKSAKPNQVVRPGDLKYADLNGDGVIDGYDQKYQGYPNTPNTTAGLQLGVRYKGFNIGVFFQGSMNFNVSAAAEAIRAFSSNMTSVHQNSWTPERGDNAQFPLLTFTPGISDPGSNPSTFWFISGNYIRLKTAEIGYSLPAKWVKSLKMKDVRIYSNGYDLFTWTKLSKRYQFDPEITQNSSRVIYPPQRVFNFGISATF